jgi:hypothetical protein
LLGFLLLFPDDALLVDALGIGRVSEWELTSEKERKRYYFIEYDHT